MGKIKQTILAHLDLDWFAVDRLGYLGHFMSNATTAVPSAIRDGVEMRCERDFWRDLADRMFDLPVKADSSIVHSYAKEWQPYLQIAGKSKREAYYAASTEWSERGFFSFNCVRKLGGDPYFLVSSPSHPLASTDLETEDRMLVEKHRFNFEFSECQTISVDAILRL